MLSNTGLQPDWTACYRGTDNGSVLQKFSGKYTTPVLKECTSCNTRTNAAVTWRDKQWPEFLNEHFEGRAIGANGPVTWPARSPDFNPSDFFLCRCMKSRVWHWGQQKVRPHLVGVQKWDCCGYHKRTVTLAVAQRLSACMWYGGGHFENVFWDRAKTTQRQYHMLIFL